MAGASVPLRDLQASRPIGIGIGQRHVGHDVRRRHRQGGRRKQGWRVWIAVGEGDLGRVLARARLGKVARCRRRHRNRSRLRIGLGRRRRPHLLKSRSRLGGRCGLWRGLGRCGRRGRSLGRFLTFGRGRSGRCHSQRIAVGQSRGDDLFLDGPLGLGFSLDVCLGFDRRLDGRRAHGLCRSLGERRREKSDGNEQW